MSAVAYALDRLDAEIDYRRRGPGPGYHAHWRDEQDLSDAWHALAKALAAATNLDDGAHDALLERVCWSDAAQAEVRSWARTWIEANRGT